MYIDKIVPFFINPGDDQRITQLMEHCEVNVAYFIEDELTMEKRVRPMREGTFLYYSLKDIEELLVSLVGTSMKKFSFEEKNARTFVYKIKGIRKRESHGVTPFAFYHPYRISAISIRRLLLSKRSHPLIRMCTKIEDVFRYMP